MTDPKTDYPGLLKGKDVCRMLAICPRTLKQYTKDGTLTPYKLPGGHYRYRFVDVLGLLQGCDGDLGPFSLDTWDLSGKQVAPGTHMGEAQAQALAQGGRS